MGDNARLWRSPIRDGPFEGSITVVFFLSKANPTFSEGE